MTTSSRAKEGNGIGVEIVVEETSRGMMESSERGRTRQRMPTNRDDDEHDADADADADADDDDDDDDDDDGNKDNKAALRKEGEEMMKVAENGNRGNEDDHDDAFVIRVPREHVKKLIAMAEDPTRVIVPFLSVFVALVITGRITVLWTWMIVPMWKFLLHVVGTVIGIGLGLGFAIHVYERLELLGGVYPDEGTIYDVHSPRNNMISNHNGGGGGGSNNNNNNSSGGINLNANQRHGARFGQAGSFHAGSSASGASMMASASASASSFHGGGGAGGAGGAGSAAASIPKSFKRGPSSSSSGIGIGGIGGGGGGALIASGSVPPPSVLGDAKHQDPKLLYTELMTSAGYDVFASNEGAASPLLRGQIVKTTSTFFRPNYPFTADVGTGRHYLRSDTDVLQYKAVICMQEQWPHLPRAVTRELGRFIEHIMRDYVSSWYSMLDASCRYEDEATKRKRIQQQQQQKQQQKQQQQQQQQKGKTHEGAERISKASGALSEDRNGPSADEPESHDKKDSSTTEQDQQNQKQHSQPHQQPPQPQQHHHHHHQYAVQRTMILNTAGHRPAPLVDTMYTVMTILFGNLTQRVEGVNVFSLLLLKWTKVLSQTLKTYRQLRKAALLKQQAHSTSASGTASRPSFPAAALGRSFRGSNKQRSASFRMPKTNPATAEAPDDVAIHASMSSSSIFGGTTGDPSCDHPQLLDEPPHQNSASHDLSASPATGGVQTLQPVSEIAVTKEFLMTGKLHRAITFGMDVPSLLFADASGKECCSQPTAQEDAAKKESNGNHHNHNKTPDDVLEERLLAMLKDCEVDYNRVLASRLARALLPRAEFSSPIIRSLITELLAGCVLTPVMSCFCPDYLNGWIVDACTTTSSPTTTSTDDNAADANNKSEDEGGANSPTAEIQCDSSAGEGLVRGWNGDLAAETVATSTSTITTPRGDDAETMLSQLPTDDNRNKESVAKRVDLVEDDDVILQDATSPGKSSVGFEMTVSPRNGDTTNPSDGDARSLFPNDSSSAVEVLHDAQGSDFLADSSPALQDDDDDDVDDDDEEEMVGVKHHLEVTDDDDDDDDEIKELEDEVDDEDDDDDDAHHLTIDHKNGHDSYGEDLLGQSDAGIKDEDDLDDGEVVQLDPDGKEDDGDDTPGSAEVDENGPTEPPSGDFILPLLTMSLIDLQRFLDFDESREAKMRQEELDIRWDDQSCQDAITQLVLIIEAALVHGRRKNRQTSSTEHQRIESEVYEKSRNGLNENEDFESEEFESEAVEVSLTRYEPSSFSQVLMDMTSDMDSFEDRISEAERFSTGEEFPSSATESGAYDPSTILKPTATELSTLRTLIAAWLHNGHANRVVANLMKGSKTILAPFFHDHAFMRNPENLSGFMRQLKSLEAVEVLVDTMVVLTATSMDVNCNGATVVPNPNVRPRRDLGLGASAITSRKSHPQGLKPPNSPSRSGRLQRFMGASLSLSSEAQQPPTGDTPKKKASPSIPVPVPSANPPYLEFGRNCNFAGSLRTERERRAKSWQLSSNHGEAVKGVPIICHNKGATEQSIAIHRELHQVARVFYAATNVLSIRNGARKIQNSNYAENSNGDGSNLHSPGNDVIPLSLLAVETAGPKRRIEVPDEDSSFLLRAQARPLNAVGVHRDQRNHGQSYKCFVASYEESALRPGPSKYTGGRYIKRCLLRYHPNDRTATIAFAEDNRELDQRVQKQTPPETIQVGKSTSSTLTDEFLRERHLCQKWTPKGGAPRSGSILASSVMELSDFTAAPRNGKALEFIYRMSLFERPMVDLDGKKFTVHDASTITAHRADASSLEMSDASISIAMLHVGRDWAYIDQGVSSVVDDEEEEGEGEGGGEKQLQIRKSSVEVASDGYPVLFIKYNRKVGGDRTVTEVKPYRASHVRASLMIVSARLEAQHMCLIKCVKAGSAREATKARTDALLMPTLTLLDYASSPEREKQSVLLRDLKLGINHIDREQLRRNGLLSPRHPTIIQSLEASVEGATSVKEPGAIPGMAPSMVLYKIRIVAIVTLDEVDAEDAELALYALPDGTVPNCFREEWIIYRPFRDFSTFHRHLKTQVAPSEQSASAGARLVGAATAAFTVGATVSGGRRRQALIPSLGQATKAGALGVTKKSIQKRCSILDNYLKYLLSDRHLLNRCSELLVFLGAAYPLPTEVRTNGEAISNIEDPLGRVAITRRVHEMETEKSPSGPGNGEGGMGANKDGSSVGTAQTEAESVRSLASGSTIARPGNSSKPSAKGGGTGENAEDDADAPTKSTSARVKEIDMIPSIKAKIDEVPLARVRSAVFELIRYQFDFDNASFFRNRMFAALKTMSFAVTSSNEFRKMLYETHINYVSSNEIAGWIKFTLEMLWPDGVFFKSGPPPTAEESRELRDKAQRALPEAFPDQIKSVLGQEITQNGLHMLHEMCQNRVVIKSLAYMLFDLLWLEVFPELQDILTGSEALQSE